MATKKTIRFTLFKIANEADRKRLIDQYTTLYQTQEKDGKPYILSVRVGHTAEDQRRQGYTLAVETVFSSLEDMQYYDTECAAHKALKAVASSVADGRPLVVFFSPSVEESLIES